MAPPSASQCEDFQEILERLRQAADDAPPDPPHTRASARSRSTQSEHRFRRTLDDMSGVGAAAAYTAPRLLNRLYERGRLPARPRLPTEDDLVAAELRLTPDLSRQDLHRIRRRFALENHPDRVPPHERERATHRMSIANRLIDQALRAKRSRRG